MIRIYLVRAAILNLSWRIFGWKLCKNNTDFFAENCLVMSRLTGADVLERIWADSGDEDELSDSEFENNDNSDESEGSDQDGAELSSEDEVVNDVEDEDSSQWRKLTK